MEGLQLTVSAAYLVVGLLAVRLWRRHRSPAAAWLAAAFGVLGFAVAVGRVVPFLPAGAAGAVALGSRVLLVTFPYLLFRFAAAFQPAGRVLRATAAGLAAAAVAVTVVLPGPQAEPPAWYAAGVFGVVAAWTVLTGWVVWRLWRSGRRQPTMARRRLRMLALAAAVLNVALVGAGVSATADAPEALVAAIQLVALGSAGLFYLGFAPPVLLRQAWRRADERPLWRAVRGLISATSGLEAVSAMLPHVSRLLGGGPVLFVDESGAALGHGDGAHGLRPALADAHPAVGDLARSSDLVVLGLRGGRLGVGIAPATPLFGTEELELLVSLGSLIDLAWARTELHQREHAARARAESLAGELESLVYGLSHDLRRPVVSVLGYVECLEEDYGEVIGEEGRHFLSRLRTNVAFMDELIGDLLSLSRVGRVDENPQPVTLTSVVRDTVADLAREHPNATVEVGELPTVVVDPGRARQLFTNLVTNALVHSGRPDVLVRVSAADGVVSVADNGRGLPSTDRDRAFGLFERLDARGDGSGAGIGLAMCRRIVENAGGRIWFADVDAGADVRIELPPAPAAGAGSFKEQ